MIALVQRVKKASVVSDGTTLGNIERGLLIFLGIHELDQTSDANWLARKCVRLRIFPNHKGQMDRSVQDIDGDVLLISQFTLYGNATKGYRPSFTDAASPEIAEPLYEYFKDKLSQELGRKICCGKFGASMQVSLINEGPVTIWLKCGPDKINL